jgi:hypothetical protein
LCPCSSLKVSGSSMRRYSSRVVRRGKWGVEEAIDGKTGT